MTTAMHERVETPFEGKFKVHDHHDITDTSYHLYM